MVFIHTKKTRGENSWIQRHEWNSINGIHNTSDTGKKIKKSQLKAIKSVIANDDDLGNVIRQLSSRTPLCFVFESKDGNFIIGDCGSISVGQDEFDGFIILIISPKHSLVFPRIKTAINIYEKSRYSPQKPTLLYEYVKSDFVEEINEIIKKQSYEYYIDINRKS
jgi:hypothetical protein